MAQWDHSVEVLVVGTGGAGLAAAMSAGDAGLSCLVVRPNPNLGPLLRGPFTAVKLVPCDLGTKVGLLTDADARVVDEHGAPIPGLDAAGNTSASVMGRAYPGPGSTLGPAVVFGYRAAQPWRSSEAEPPAPSGWKEQRWAGARTGCRTGRPTSRRRYAAHASG